MSLIEIAVITVSCLVFASPVPQCVADYTVPRAAVAGAVSGPSLTGESLDVVLTAEAALAWDVNTGMILYEKQAEAERPVASLSKLASTLVARDLLSLTEVVVIPTEAARAQRLGANIKLPVGEHTTVRDLMAASLVASANDAMVGLAVAASGSEEAFVDEVNRRLPEMGITHTQLANSTGLSGGVQFSTARDVQTMLMALYEDPTLQTYLSSRTGVLETQEGSRRVYETTNKLLGSYLPVLAAKTGYTAEAKQNLAMITRAEGGQEIGAVILGSDARFQDMKVLVEWINRNYTW